MRLTRLTVVLGSLVLAASLATPAAAEPTRGSHDIIGGDFVSSAPWAAALYYDGYGFYCSGTIIAPRWVLTAKHCYSPGYAMSVRVGNVNHTRGTNVRISRVAQAPGGDMVLLYLARAFDTSYARLTNTDPPLGATNHIYGWGTTEVGEQAPMSERLKAASVRVTSTNASDYFGGRAVGTRKISGTAGYGDSGGPQFHGDVQVGVCSTGDYVNTQYASVAAHRAWIRQVAGV